MRRAGFVVGAAAVVLVVAWLACWLRPECRPWMAAPDLGDPPLGWPAAAPGT